MERDYNKFLKTSNKYKYTVKKSKKSNSSKTVKSSSRKHIIERKYIMTREEIEAKEYENFIKNNDFNLDLKNV
jgi:hypothetical protein